MATKHQASNVGRVWRSGRILAGNPRCNLRSIMTTDILRTYCDTTFGESNQCICDGDLSLCGLNKTLEKVISRERQMFSRPLALHNLQHQQDLTPLLAPCYENQCALFGFTSFVSTIYPYGPLISLRLHRTHQTKEQSIRSKLCGVSRYSHSLLLASLRYGHYLSARAPEERSNGSTAMSPFITTEYPWWVITLNDEYMVGLYFPSPLSHALTRSSRMQLDAPWIHSSTAICILGSSINGPTSNRY